MSAADEDTELRDLLVQTLDKNGVLGKIKAELRASIFLALEAQEQNKTQNPLKNSNLQKFLATENGKLCIGIINQFLSHFNLDYTAAVFGPEISANEMLPLEDEIKKSLNLDGGSKGDTASSTLLSRIVQVVKSENSSNHGLKGPQIQFLQSKFHSFDHTSSGSIGKHDVATVISLSCPLMNTATIEKFVTDELKSVSSSSVTFDSFLTMFQKFYDMCVSVVTVGNKTKLPPQSSFQSPSNKSSHYLEQNAPFHQVPASPTPLSEPEPIKSAPASGGSGMPSNYIMSTNDRAQNSSMEVGYDPFFDSQPAKEPSGAREQPSENAYAHTDTPALSPESSSDWQKESKSGEIARQQQQYEDDFHSEQSISEEIQDMADDLLQSSERDESVDLTEDHTVSEIPHADYMEDIRHA